MQNASLKWVYLFILAIIWGSSFILIKKGLIGLTPLQLGALRITLTSFFLFIIGWKSLKSIKRSEWKWIIISGLLGTGIPVFLFAYAETEIDSAVAAILNSGVPLLALITGLLFFKATLFKRQFIGILIGLIGAIALILIGANINPNQNYWYALLVVIATACYALNVNIIKAHLQHLSAMAIAVGNFIFLIPFSLYILGAENMFTIEKLEVTTVQTAIGYVAILSLFGTALAKVMFNKLVQISDPVFASSVTYLMPIISVMWGVMDGEIFVIKQLGAAFIILLGVYLANKKAHPKKDAPIQ